jgi:hypothetical protein
MYPAQMHPNQMGASVLDTFAHRNAPGNLWGMPGPRDDAMYQHNQLGQQAQQFNAQQQQPTLPVESNSANSLSGQMGSETDDIFMLQNIQNMRFDLDSPSPDSDSNNAGGQSNVAVPHFGMWVSNSSSPGRN